MQRQPEPEELMDDEEQARAYAEADFDAPHTLFMELFRARFGEAVTGRVLDLGCGSGDITCRFVQRYPDVMVDAVDGAPTMLRLADVMLHLRGVAGRVKLHQRHLPDISGLAPTYGVIISNSLLHHLHDPKVMWQCISPHLRPGTVVFVMDLLRPEGVAEARRLVTENAGAEPAVLQRDFYNSLLAAYRLDEVQAQLLQAGLAWLTLEQVSDRHFVVSGCAP